jgi:glutamate racemase
MDQPPIGVFDSGVGGLAILRNIRDLLPNVEILYFADQKHVPYGTRSMGKVRAFAEEISRFLINKGCGVIVVACNTASAAALHHLRSTFPNTPFVGMEPAVKPAALTSHTQRVGVLATPATFQGELFASVVERFAQDVEVIEQTLPGIVEKIESLELDSPETRAILSKAIHPMLDKGIDTLVLACTHYTFVVPIIQKVVGDDIVVIDPSPAIARQTKRVWQPLSFVSQEAKEDSLVYYSSLDPERLSFMAVQLIDLQGISRKARWDGMTLQSVED